MKSLTKPSRSVGLGLGFGLGLGLGMGLVVVDFRSESLQTPRAAFLNAPLRDNDTEWGGKSITN